MCFALPCNCMMDRPRTEFMKVFEKLCSVTSYERDDFLRGWLVTGNQVCRLLWSALLLLLTHPPGTPKAFFITLPVKRNQEDNWLVPTFPGPHTGCCWHGQTSQCEDRLLWCLFSWVWWEWRRGSRINQLFDIKCVGSILPGSSRRWHLVPSFPRTWAGAGRCCCGKSWITCSLQLAPELARCAEWPGTAQNPLERGWGRESRFDLRGGPVVRRQRKKCCWWGQFMLQLC